MYKIIKSGKHGGGPNYELRTELMPRVVLAHVEADPHEDLEVCRVGPTDEHQPLGCVVGVARAGGLQDGEGLRSCHAVVRLGRVTAEASTAFPSSQMLV